MHVEFLETDENKTYRVLAKMSDINIQDYKRFSNGINEQYNNLLTQKEIQLKTVEQEEKKMYDNICCKLAEYNMLCSVYGSDSQKADEILEEIKRLISEYDKECYNQKLDNLKSEIEWLKSKGHIYS